MLLSCLTYMVIGIAHVVVGSVMEPMLRDYHLHYQDGGQIIMNQFLGFLIGVLGISWLLRKLGRKKTLLFALGSLTIGEIVYASGLGWNWMLVSSLFVGIGFGLSEALIGAFVIDVSKERAAVAMSRVEVFFSVGALAMPLLAAFFIQIEKWQLSFWTVALFSGLAFVLWMLYWPHKTLHPTVVQRTVSNALPRYEKQSFSFLFIGALFFVVYVGLEMSFANYLPSFLVAKGELEASSATAGMGLFWGAMSIGRLFAGHLAIRYGSGQYLLVSCVVAVLILVSLAVVSHSWIMIGLALLLGFTLSGVFAIALVFVNDGLPGMIERTTSILIACGGLGGAIFPKFTGWVLDHFDTTITQWLLSALALLLFALMLTILYLAKRVFHKKILLTNDV